MNYFHLTINTSSDYKFEKFILYAIQISIYCLNQVLHVLRIQIIVHNPIIVNHHVQANSASHPCRHYSNLCTLQLKYLIKLGITPQFYKGYVIIYPIRTILYILSYSAKLILVTIQLHPTICYSMCHLCISLNFPQINFLDHEIMGHRVQFKQVLQNIEFSETQQRYFTRTYTYTDLGVLGKWS